MDPRLLDAIDETMPRFNTDLTKGFHSRQFDDIVKWYERQLRMTLQSLESKGVKFHGLRPVRPDEMFKVISETTQNKTFETNRESLYPTNIHITYTDNQGTEHSFDNIYVMLPFTDEYGDIYIRDSLCSLQIVLADRGLSVTKDEQIFVKILGYKFKIGTENVGFVRHYPSSAGNRTARMQLNLPANRFYTPKEAWRVNPKKVPEPLLAWYMFAEHGVTKTMEKYGECEIAVGDVEVIRDSYPESEGWEIYASAGRRTERQLTKTFIYNPFAIAVRPNNRKRGEIPTVALQYVASLLFLFDCGSALVDLDRLDDRMFWRLIIGMSSMSSRGGSDNILRQMSDHFQSIYEYMDESSIKRFAAQRIVVDDMFDLFNYIIANRTEIVKTVDRADMLHKEVCSLEYTMDRLIIRANRFKHEIKNITDLNTSKVSQTIVRWFGLRDIEPAARESNLIQESTPTDCPLADYVLGVMTQAKVCSSRGGKRAGFNVSDPANSIHPSLPFTMSAERITKPDPDGRGYLAPCAVINMSNCVVLDPKLRELYERTSSRLTVRQPRDFKDES
ncbi:phage protein [Vibrio phage pTD1]|uniref:Phage protein n=1 Tax=Vibrio phage pTD1 TaxID=1938577 RepID=A0A1Q2U2S7_9CAUD|nr:polymerase [Vibrio phage pTD1]BAW98272.1 phage protein [Vibrio phage pTD1]